MATDALKQVKKREAARVADAEKAVKTAKELLKRVRIDSKKKVKRAQKEQRESAKAEKARRKQATRAKKAELKSKIKTAKKEARAAKTKVEQLRKESGGKP